VLAGTGRRLFAQGATVQLTRQQGRTTLEGLQVLVYTVDR
jgi:hypothetical protein